MDTKVRSLVRLASGQHGTIAVRQLLGLGFTRDQVTSWVRRGLLHREFRGVYRLGHRAPSVEARYIAAVLAAGAGAVLSGLPAAYLYGVIGGDAPAPEISVPGGCTVAGIRCRRRTIDRRLRSGIPVATLPQTIVDLAAVMDLETLGHVCHKADVRYRLRRIEIGPVPGAAKLRAIYEGDHDLILSRMERAFKRLLVEHALPRARTNRPQGKHYVDCRWPGVALTVELDSFAFHHTRHAWEADRERERAARRRGDEFRRYTWRDVVEKPAEMLSELRVILDI